MKSAFHPTFSRSQKVWWALAAAATLWGTSKAHAQAAAVLPFVQNLVNVGRSSVDGVSSFAAFQEKVLGGSTQGTINPFTAQALPKDAVAEQMHGWKRNKLLCHFTYRDGMFGAWSDAIAKNRAVQGAWSQITLTPNAKIPRFAPTNAIALDFSIGYIYNGQLSKTPGRYLGNVTFVKESLNLASGWESFEANVGAYPPRNAGTDEEPLAAMDLVVQFKVGNIAQGKHEFSKIYHIYADGRMAEASKGLSSESMSDRDAKQANLECKGFSEESIEKTEVPVSFQ